MKMNNAEYIGKIIDIKIDSHLVVSIQNIDLYIQLIMDLFQIQLVVMVKNWIVIYWACLSL